jgi:hypothetical protein
MSATFSETTRTTTTGNGLAIGGTILGIVDVVLFALVLAFASHHGASWHVG